MGKRTIIYCDLCHNEAENLIPLPFKKGSNQYELCHYCNDQLYQQFDNLDKKLQKDMWRFASVGTPARPKPTVLPPDNLSDDDKLIAEKMSSNDRTEASVPETVESGGIAQCNHMNKTPKRLEDGKFVQRCKNAKCNKVFIQ